MIEFIKKFHLDKGSGKIIIFKTRKRNCAKIEFRKAFDKLLNNSFYRKTMENVRNRMLEFIKKDDKEN